MTSYAENTSEENISFLTDGSGALSMLAMYSITASLNLDIAETIHNESIKLTANKVSNPFPHNDTHLLTPLGNKPFENTMGKEKIARSQQFLLYPQCFLPV